MNNARLQAMTADAKAIKEKIEVAEADLKMLNEAYRQRVERDIPALMQELGLSDATLEDGTTVTVSEQIFASISEERQAAAFAWLTEHGLGGIIKEVTKVSVHPMTLKAQNPESQSVAR